jgi:hypothetical protein
MHIRVRSGIEGLFIFRPPASVKLHDAWMILTKFNVLFASHQANSNSSLSLTQNRIKLVYEIKFEMETTEKFSSNFLRTL